MWKDEAVKSVGYMSSHEDGVSAKGGTMQDRKDMWRVGRDQELNVSKGETKDIAVSFLD